MQPIPMLQHLILSQKYNQCHMHFVPGCMWLSCLRPAAISWAITPQDPEEASVTIGSDTVSLSGGAYTTCSPQASETPCCCGQNSLAEIL